MAFIRTLKQGPPRKQGGQGAVEAVVALPVFLFLVCLVFQLFLLGLAQVQLQYAAFYAARVGVVHSSDKKEMEQAVGKIVTPLTGIFSLPEGSFRVEILRTGERKEAKKWNLVKGKDTLKVQVHWQYPLTIPIADVILKTRSQLLDPRKPYLHLRASWVMPTFESPSKEENHDDGQST